MFNKIYSFNFIIERLNIFWRKNGCIILQPVDSEVGAATFHPATFINAIKGSYYKAAYTQFSRRPFDSRLNASSNKSSIFHQYQVIIKPSLHDIKQLYLLSLKFIGINTNANDIKFIEDNWKSPTLGASGIGWEVRLNGVEITQFTYFQQMGSVECFPVMVELAYGLERLAMYIQKVSSIDDIIFDIVGNDLIRYSSVFKKYENDYTNYILEDLKIVSLNNEFDKLEKDVSFLINKKRLLIAYDYLIKLSNIFNLIDAKICYGFLRQRYISRIKVLAKKIAIEIKHEQ